MKMKQVGLNFVHQVHQKFGGFGKVVRGAGAKYRVVKNTIAEKASEGTGSAELLKALKGMSSIAYTSGDPVALAKALTVYAKANPSFSFRAGVVEGHSKSETRRTSESAPSAGPWRHPGLHRQ